MKRAAALLALAMLACGGEKKAADPCEARINAIAARLERAARYAEPSGAPPEVPLPEATGGIPLEGTPPVLVVGPEEVRLAGRGVGGEGDELAARLASDLRALREVSVESDDGAPWTVALWADPSTSLERLGALLSQASADASFALLVRASDVRAPRGESPPEEVQAALRARPGESVYERRERLDLAWERATATCESARGHLPIPASLAPSGPPMGAPTTEPLVDALRRCGCEGTDLVAMEAIALAALVSSEGPLVRMPPALRFGHATDDARETTARGTVADLATAIAGRPAEPLWIVVE